MFEHQLIDMAVADRRHIVLPEGDDDRILQAADIVLPHPTTEEKTS